MPRVLVALSLSRALEQADADVIVGRHIPLEAGENQLVGYRCRPPASACTCVESHSARTPIDSGIERRQRRAQFVIARGDAQMVRLMRHPVEAIRGKGLGQHLVQRLGDVGVSADWVVWVCRSPAIQRPLGTAGAVGVGGWSPPQATKAQAVATAAARRWKRRWPGDVMCCMSYPVVAEKSPQGIKLK
jgi:hypothetical protein